MNPYLWLVFTWGFIGIGIWALARSSDDIRPAGAIILGVAWPLLAVLCVLAIALAPLMEALIDTMDGWYERKKRGK